MSTKARIRLAPGQVESILTSLGIDVIEHNGSELVALCPGHQSMVGRPDTHPSWSINEETGIHYCFSCHYKGNVIGLVRDMRGEEEANLLSDDFRRPTGDFAAIEKRLNESQLRRAKREEEQTVTPGLLSRLDIPPAAAMDDRHVSEESCDAFGIRWKDGHWVLPLYYPDGRLMGWQEKAHVGRSFYNRPRLLPKSKTLFGFPVAEALGHGTVIVVESPLDAVRLHSMGYSAVAVCGSKVSHSQIDLLIRYRRVIVALDNDVAGTKEMERLRKVLPKRGVRAMYLSYRHTEAKDVGDMDDAEIVRAVANAAW